MLAIINFVQLQISVARLELSYGSLKRIRGSTALVDVLSDDSCNDVLQKAIEKHRLSDVNMPTAEYALLYQDYSRVRKVPGTDKPFTVGDYKAFAGKPYQQLLLYIVTEEDMQEVLYDTRYRL